MVLSYMFFIMLIYIPYKSRNIIFISALFTIAKILKRPKYSSTDEWIKKMWYTHKVDYYLPFKKKRILPSATRKYLEVMDMPVTLTVMNDFMDEKICPNESNCIH